MTEKFVRSEWERYSTNPVGYTALMYDNDRPTLQWHSPYASEGLLDLFQSFEDRLTALSSLENKVVDLKTENKTLKDDVNYLREKVRELDEYTYLSGMHEGNEITHFNLSTGEGVSTPIKKSEEPSQTDMNVAQPKPKHNFDILFSNDEVVLWKSYGDTPHHFIIYLNENGETGLSSFDEALRNILLPYLEK